MGWLHLALGESINGGYQMIMAAAMRRANWLARKWIRCSVEACL